MKLSDTFRRGREILASDGFVALAGKAARLSSDTLKTTLLPRRFAALRNYRLAIDEWRRRAIKLEAKPRDITIESTTFCNLRCVMCEHAIEGMVDKRHFPEHLVTRLSSFMATASRFQLHSLGEPLVSPTFWRVLEHISSAHGGAPEITFNSNGLLLSEKTISRLLASKASEIIISLDAVSDETYRRIRGSDFSKLLRNVTALIKARDATRRSGLTIVLHMTLMRANIEELPEFVRLTKELGADEVAFWRLNEGENYQRPDWVVRKGDWRFSYSEESAKCYPNLFNAKIREALAIGGKLKIPIREDFNNQILIEGEGQRADRVYQPWLPAPTIGLPRVKTVSLKLPDKSAGAGEANPGAAGAPSARQCETVPITEEVSPARRHGAKNSACEPAVASEGNNVAQPTAQDRAVILPFVALAEKPTVERLAEDAPVMTSPHIGKCEAPWRWLLINNRGDCKPCCFLQGSVGSLEHETAEQIRNGAPMQEIRASIAKGQVHRLCQGASCQYVRGQQPRSLPISALKIAS